MHKSAGEFAVRHICRLAAVPLAAILWSSPAIPAQSSNSTIVVRGTRLDPQQARQRAVDFVKRTGVAHGQQQVARWVIPVCIKVIGLGDVQAERVQRIMLDIAREANIRAGGSKCEPNITVSFTADAGNLVRHIHARKPLQLAELTRAEKEQLLNGTAPVRWWYATTMLERDGMEANSISAGWITNGATSAANGTGPVGLPLGDGVTSTQQYNSGSNVRTPTVRSLYGATVVVDAPKAGDTPVDAVAAYAAMVAFAEMNATAPPPDSILNLFQPNSIETSLTDWDLAFLKSLYRMPLDRRSRIQRGHLVEALLDERLPNEKVTKKP